MWFSPTVVGQVAPVQHVTFTNPDTRAQVVQQISITPANAGFAKSDDCGVSLAAGASCTVNVAFTPAGTGPWSGQLDLTLSSGASSISLSGSGVVRSYAKMDAATAGNGTLSSDGLSWWGAASYVRATLPINVDAYFEVQRTQNGYVDVAFKNGAGFLVELDSHGNLYNPGFLGGLGPWNNSVIGVAWTVNTRTLAIYYDGVLRGSRSYPELTGDVYPMLYSNGGTITANFGATPFAYGPPAGFPAGLYR